MDNQNNVNANVTEVVEEKKSVMQKVMDGVKTVLTHPVTTHVGAAVGGGLIVEGCHRVADNKKEMDRLQALAAATEIADAPRRGARKSDY